MLNAATNPLVVIVLLAALLASHSPLCSLSAILFVLAYNMHELYLFTDMLRSAPKLDVTVLMITFVLTVLLVAMNC